MRVAAIDIGSNSVRLLVKDDSGLELARRVIVSGLGRGVDASRRLADESILRTLSVLGGYRVEIAGLDVDVVGAVATSATRDAANRDEFLDGAEQALGVRPRVIDGSEEAQLTFAGAVEESTARTLVIDIGGGSTEFALGRGEPSQAISVDMGSVRLTDRAIPDRPAPPSQVAGAREEADLAFSYVPFSADCARVVGVAGTFTALTGIILGLDQYDRDAVHGTTVTGVDLTDMIERLAVLNVEETEALPSLDPARAPVILAGAIVAERALLKVGADRVMVSESDLLDALASELLQQ